MIEQYYTMCHFCRQSFDTAGRNMGDDICCDLCRPKPESPEVTAAVEAAKELLARLPSSVSADTSLSPDLPDELLAEIEQYCECLRIAMTALKQIADFSHTGGPHCCKEAPVTECECNSLSQGTIARRALTAIDRGELS